MKKNILMTALALFVAIFAATAAMAAPRLVINNNTRGRISLGETSLSSNNIYFSGLVFEVEGTGEATTGTLTITTNRMTIWGRFIDDSGKYVDSVEFIPGTPVKLNLKRQQGTSGVYYMIPCDANGNTLSIDNSTGDNQIAFSGASFKLKVGSEPEVSGTIPTMLPTTDFTRDLGIPYVKLRYSEDRKTIEGVDWKFVKMSDPKTTLTYHTGDQIAYVNYIRANKFDNPREQKYVDKTFANGDKMEGSITFDKSVDLVDLSAIRVSFRLSDSLDTSKVYVPHAFNFYMQGNLVIESGVSIRQSFGKAKGGDGSYSSFGLPQAGSMWFEITGQGANKTGTLEFTPKTDVTASYSRSGIVEATEVYKAGVKRTLVLVRGPVSFVATMDPRDSSGRYIDFRPVDGSEDNVYALNGTRYIAKIGNSTIEDTIADYKRVSELVANEATSNIKCYVNSAGKITKIDWWFSKGDDRTVAAKYADGDEINYVGHVQIRTRKSKDMVRVNAPGFGKPFNVGDTMSGTWELDEDQYVSLDDVQSIRVGGAHRYRANSSDPWKYIYYTTTFVPVAEVIDGTDVKDTGSDGAKVESAEPNQPTPSEFASAIEALVDAMKRVMELIKDSPVLKAFDVINTIKMEVTHSKDDGTANVAIENFEREPKAGYEFVVLTKRKISLADGGKWDMHRGVKYDRAAHRLSFSIPNVGWYFSTSDVVLAEAQIDGGSNGGSGGGCAAGAAAMLALGYLVAIKARKR